MRIIPRIDIKNDFLIKGINFEGLRKLGDPEIFIKKYYEAGCHEVLISDVVASLYGRNHLFDFIKKITKEIFIPVTIIGGIRDIDDIKNALNAGADKVGLNTAIVNDISFLSESIKYFGESNIVVSIEAKRLNNKWEVYTNSGRERTNIDIFDWIEEIQKIGCGEILITSIDSDGGLNGFDKKLLLNLSKKKIKKPLILSGGFASNDHINEFKKYFNNDAISIGSAFHYGNLKVKETIKKFGD